MKQSDDAVVTPKLHSRLFAICFAVFLAISMGCGIGAAALADGIEDLDSGMQEPLVLVQEDVSASAMPAMPARRPRPDALCLRKAGNESGAVASTARPDQVPYIHRNGGMPRAINPTGPPLRA